MYVRTYILYSFDIIRMYFIQDAAVASLKSLNKGDVVEVRALQRPPLGVKLVIDAVCIMKEIKPKKVRK